MCVVVALGGNALLRRGQAMTEANQRANARVAAESLAALAQDHQIVVTHGNGPQIGLLALQGAAYNPDEVYSLDVLGAESEGMVGYLIEQEMRARLGSDRSICTLLTMVEIDPNDSAFDRPTKPIGPVYKRAEAERLAASRGWSIARDGTGYRRVVASPVPLRIVEIEPIRHLVDHDVIVLCAGGGGIPTASNGMGRLEGVEAVVDKDRAGALLATELKADAYLMLTDVDAVVDGWGSPHTRRIARGHPTALSAMGFAAGSMGPKVQAACSFAGTTGRIAGIGAMADAAAILGGTAGTTVSTAIGGVEWWP